MNQEHALVRVVDAVRRHTDDQDAWRRMYLAFRKPVLGYLFMLGFKETADREDLASEVFFRFLTYSPWRNDWSTLPAPAVITAYLRKTAQNVAYTAMKNNVRREDTEEELSALPRVSSLDRLGDNLTAQEQAFIAAYVASGYSLSRLATARNATYSAVATQLHRIRKKIRAGT